MTRLKRGKSQTVKRGNRLPKVSIQKLNLYFYIFEFVESETYSKEFLRRKASRLDSNMVDNLMEKYQDHEDGESDGSGYQIKEHDPKLESDVKNIVKQMSKEEMDDDVARDICLPSIKDSKLWRVKVIPGQERALVFKITNKLIDYLNMGNPLNVLEVFES